MIKRSKIERLIAEKKAKNRNKAVHVGVFICVMLYIILYEIWWTGIPAYNDLIYKIGIILSTLSYSVVASYIFYFIITVVPENKKRKEIAIALQHYQENLSDTLNRLMIVLFQEENWKSMDAQKLREEYIEKSKTREIRSETYWGIIKDKYATNYVHPDTLFVLSEILDSLDNTLFNIIELANYIKDINYLEDILKFSEAETMEKLRRCKDAVMQDAYLDYIFKVELPEYIFDEKLGIFQTVKNLIMWDEI